MFCEEICLHKLHMQKRIIFLFGQLPCLVLLLALTTPYRRNRNEKIFGRHHWDNEDFNLVTETSNMKWKDRGGY